MKKFKLLLSLVLAFLLVFAFGCKEDNPPVIDWDSKTVESIEAVQETFDKEYEYDEFDISMLKIKVYYTDGTSREISVDESMLSEKDAKKLTSPNTPRITIEYGGEEAVSRVHLIDSSRLDENLNKDGEYACVIKAIRDKDKEIINFIFEGNNEYSVCAMSFEFIYDNTKMQLSDAKLDSNLKGLGGIVIEDSKIRFAYSEDGTVLEGELVLFSVKYTGDYRESGLAISTDFDNVVYVANTATYETTRVNNVLYHVSVK